MGRGSFVVGASSALVARSCEEACCGGCSQGSDAPRYGPRKDGLASTGHLHPGLRVAVKLPKLLGKVKEKGRAAARP